MTKQTIVNDLINSGFELDGSTDYKRVQAFVLAEYNRKLSNTACWAVINELKHGGVEELDFN